MKKIKYAMVGGGFGAFIGPVHRMAAELSGCYELVAGAFGLDAGKSLEYASELNVRGYANYEKMLQEEAGLEDGARLISIVTPNFAHFVVAKMALELGFDVLCEKPLTMTLEEALELQALVQSTNRTFAVAHAYACYPMVQQARQMVAKGALGDIRIIQSEYPQDWLATPAEKDASAKQAIWRTNPKLTGTGCLGDIGTHALHTASFIAGLVPSHVLADMNTFVDDRAVDDHIQVLLKYDTGAKGMLWSSQVAIGEENGLKVRIYGSKGSLQWEQMNPETLIFDSLGKARQIIRKNRFDCTAPSALMRVPAGHPEGYVEAFANLYFLVAQKIGQKNQLDGNNSSEQGAYPDITDGVLGMRFIDAVLKSAQNNNIWAPL